MNKSAYETSFIRPHLAQVHHSASIKLLHPPHVQPTGPLFIFASRSALNRAILSYADDLGFNALCTGLAVLDVAFGFEASRASEIHAGRSTPHASHVRYVSGFMSVQISQVELVRSICGVGSAIGGCC